MAARSTPASHWKQQVARIRVPRDDKVGVGTGVLISQQHVLTAWHVVAPDGVFVDGSLVDLPDLASPLTNLAATLAWRHDTEDIALLRLESQLQVPPLLQLAQSEPQQAVEGEIYGYARGSATAPDPKERAASPFVASLHTPSLGKPLNIAPDHPADVWSGLSGAPVVHKGWILGVISAKNDWEKCTRLFATSIETLRDTLRKQILVDLPGASDIASDPLVVALERNVDVLVKLANHANLQPEPRTVAAWLARSGEASLDAIDVARRALREVEGAASELRKITELLLPRLPAWAALAHSVATQLQAQRVSSLETPLLNELLIEGLSAFLDGRPCAFVPGKSPPVGRGLVPSGLEAGPDPRGARFAHSVLADLYRYEGGGIQDPHGGALALAGAASRRMDAGAVTVAAQSKFVEASLKLRIERNDPLEPPLYVILCDRDDGAADRFLDDVATQLSTLLPSLRVFRLRLKLAPSDELLSIHARVQAIFAS